MMDPEEFKRIRTEILGMSQREMAQALGVSGDETIRRWEQGQRQISRTVQILIGYLVQEARRQDRV